MSAISYVVVSTPRSGTLYTAKLFSALGLRCTHEQYFSARRRLLTDESQPLFGDSSWLAAPFLEALPRDTLILHQVRDPIRTINSLIHTGICSPSRLGEFEALGPTPPTAHPFGLFLWCHTSFPDMKVPEEELAILFWCYWHRLIERRGAGRRYFRYRLEDIGPDLLHELSVMITGQADRPMIEETWHTIPRDINTRGVAPQPVTQQTLPKEARQLASKYGFRSYSD